MATYASLTEVQNLIPMVGTLADAPATVPSLTQATAIVAAIDAEVNMHLRARGVTTPVTDTEGAASLKTTCIWGAAASILKAMFPSDGGVGGDDGSAGFYEAKYQAALAVIDGGGLSPDSTDSGNSVAHGFKDSAGTALSSSELVTRIGRETQF